MNRRLAFLAGLVVGAGVAAIAFVWLREPHGADSAGGDAADHSDTADPSGSAARPRPPSGKESAPAGLAAAPTAATREDSVTSDEAEFLRKALAEERRRRVAARIRSDDSGIDVLRRVMEERADPADVLGDFDRFASHVHAAKGRVARFAESAGAAPLVLKDSAEAKDAVVLEFGPGRFVVDAEWWGPNQGAVEELEIRGAGRDKTTLVLKRNLLQTSTDLGHMRVHDLSVESPDGLTLDVRAKAAAIFEDVRFLPWQIAGYAAPIGIGGKAYVGFRRCEFLGGGGRAGYAISLRGPALVLAEDCVFADVEATVIGGSGTAGGSVVRLVRCRFLGSPLADSRVKRGETPEIEIHVAGGEALFGSKVLSDDDRRTRWGAFYAASIDGVTFAPDPARPTLGDLLAVLDATRDVDGTPVGLEFVAAERLGQPASFGLSTWDGKSNRAKTYAIRMQSGRAVVTPDPHVAGRGVPRPGDLDGVPALAEVLRRAGVPTTLEASEIRVDTRPGEKAEVEVSVTSDRRHVATVDARTFAVRGLPK